MECSKPKIKWINKEQLRVPMDTYQRTRRNKSLMRQMKENWSTLRAGAITVVERGDGDYDVIDGGTRTIVAQGLNGQVPKLCCLVSEKCDTRKAASEFVALNKDRRAVSAIDIHRASVTAKDKFALLVNSIVTDSGYKVEMFNSDFQFAAIGALNSLVQRHPQTARDSFCLASDIARGDRIPNHLLNGIFELEMRMNSQCKGTLFSDRNTNRLVDVGVLGFMQSINKEKYNSPQNSFSRTVCGRGILAVLNSKKRTRKIHVNWY